MKEAQDIIEKIQENAEGDNEQKALQLFRQEQERLRKIDDNAQKGIYFDDDVQDPSELGNTQDSFEQDLLGIDIRRTAYVILGPRHGYEVEYYRESESDRMVIISIKFYYGDGDFRKEIKLNLSDPETRGVVNQLKRVIEIQEIVDMDN